MTSTLTLTLTLTHTQLLFVTLARSYGCEVGLRQGGNLPDNTTLASLQQYYCWVIHLELKGLLMCVRARVRVKVKVMVSIRVRVRVGLGLGLGLGIPYHIPDNTTLSSLQP